MRLTEHFTLEELVHSDTAIRLGIDNSAPPEIVPNLVTLAHGLEFIRGVVGQVVVHSGYRCEALERILCQRDYIAWCGRRGVSVEPETWKDYFSTKGHPLGYCGDITAPGFGKPVEIVRVVRNCGIKFDQLIEEGTWVHVSFDPRMRGQVLSAVFDKNGVPSYGAA